MRLEIRIDRTSARRWLMDLRDQLWRRGHDCRFVPIQPMANPRTVDLLFELERLVHRLRKPRTTDPIGWDALSRSDAVLSGPPDLVIDLASMRSEDPRKIPQLVVSYDGYTGEMGLLCPLLGGRMPVITICDAVTGAVVVRGEPATDNAGSVCEATEFAFARLVTIIMMALARCNLHPPPTTAEPRSPPSPHVSLASAAPFLARSVAYSVARHLYRLCCYAPHWRIGWRLLERPLQSVHATLNLAGPPWSVLPDPGMRFFADPFPFGVAGRQFIFFEDFDHRTSKGIISCVEIGRDGSVGPVRPVLEEAWHLSYPFLFEEDGQVWMIPESCAERSVNLYRALAFPYRWTKEATLLSGVEVSDATLVRWKGQMWMFAATRDGYGSYSDTLSLFKAPRVMGPWTPHPGNPVLVDQSAARPAGGFFVRGGQLWRPVQDCTRGYGTALGLAEILRLDDAGFEQRVRTVLRCTSGWPGRRIHTLTRHGTLECIDGSAHSPKSARLAQHLQRWTGRRQEAQP